MEPTSPALTFPTSFCCNCGDLNCATEMQDTRVTRYFGIGGTETTFRLPVPVCAGCRRSTRRRPQGFFAQLLLTAAGTAVALLVFVALGSRVELPLWIVEHRFGLSVALAILVSLGLWRLRRPKPPKTSFYQPVRIKSADLQMADVASGSSQVVYMKLAFTNSDYLNIFVNANRDAIKAGRLAVVKA